MGKWDSVRLKLLAAGERQHAGYKLVTLLGGMPHHLDHLVYFSSSRKRRSRRPSPSTAASRLLKSWAIPPVSFPTASNVASASTDLQLSALRNIKKGSENFRWTINFAGHDALVEKCPGQVCLGQRHRNSQE